MHQEEWGIDITGRKMWYEAWHTDNLGNYKQPNESEIKNTYGVSGEAFNETLLFFEEQGGDTGQLIELLNKHVLDNRFIVKRENLLDKSRWYTNEYYFYFIMFTKKIMNDYNWHFTKGENVLLSEYHMIYEHGFLRLMPYGEDEKDTSNSIPYTVIKHFTKKGYNFNDLYDWVDALTIKKTAISYKNEVGKLDNYKISGEFICYLYSFIKIILNKDNMMDMVHECFESYHLGGLSYAPESMLTKLVAYFVNKSTNFYDLKVRYNKDNTIECILEQSKTRKQKSYIYNAVASKIANSLGVAALQEVIKKLLKLKKLPEIIDLSGLNTTCCTFTLKWEKRIFSIPFFNLSICNFSFLALLLLNHFMHLDIFFPVIIIFFISINIILILFRRLKLEKHKRRIAEDHIVKISEENNKRLEKAEELSNELMLEKEALEKKVKERTAKLAKANERLKELDIAKTNFFANISHELRTPLTLMLGPLSSVINKNYGDFIAYNDEKFSLMLHNGYKLLKLINSLLDFTKIEAGKMKVKKQKTDIAEILKFYTSIVRTYAESKSISVVFNDNTINIQSKRDKMITYIDRDLLDKVIFNLLSNALKFTSNGGSIIIQLDREDNFYNISIKDTGIGIPEDKLEVIFERFSQIDSSSSRLYEGTGMGLALTKEIIELLGGRIAVTSRLGEGAIFIITLPIDKNGNSDIDEDVKKNYEVKSYLIDEFLLEQNNDIKNKSYYKGCNNIDNTDNKKKILIVEDSKDMQRYLISILENDYRLIITNNGKEGLQTVKKTKPDLILTDIMMPDMDGYQMTSLIKSQENLRGIPLLILTAKADLFMTLEGFNKGADDYIIKPFSTNELKARIKAHLEMKCLRDEIIIQKNNLIKKNKILKNIIDQKEAVFKKLNESENRFREIAEYLPVVLAELDEMMKIIYLNKTGLDLFGITNKEIEKGISFINFIDYKEREKFTREFSRLIKNELLIKSQLYEYNLKVNNGRNTIGLFKSTPIYEENKITGIRIIITEVKTYLDLIYLPDEMFYDKYTISEREKDVFLYILKGFRNREIGEKLFITERTVKKHITNILQKTGTANRQELLNLVSDLQKKSFKAF